MSAYGCELLCSVFWVYVCCFILNVIRSRLILYYLLSDLEQQPLDAVQFLNRTSTVAFRSCVCPFNLIDENVPHRIHSYTFTHTVSLSLSLSCGGSCFAPLSAHFVRLDFIHWILVLVYLFSSSLSPMRLAILIQISWMIFRNISEIGKMFRLQHGKNTEWLVCL